jgi:hypothetical protein
MKIVSAMNAPCNLNYIHVIVKQDTYLMGLLKCGLNNNKVYDLSIVFEGQRGRGTKAQSEKGIEERDVRREA